MREPNSIIRGRGTHWPRTSRRSPVVGCSTTQSTETQPSSLQGPVRKVGSGRPALLLHSSTMRTGWMGQLVGVTRGSSNTLTTWPAPIQIEILDHDRHGPPMRAFKWSPVHWMLGKGTSVVETQGARTRSREGALGRFEGRSPMSFSQFSTDLQANLCASTRDPKVP